MNSNEEKELFEAYGWEYDSIARQWNSPTGAAGVTEDSLFQFTQEREGERLLKVFIWNNTPPAMRIHPTPEFVWP
jgi:hypothetical protein